MQRSHNSRCTKTSLSWGKSRVPCSTSFLLWQAAEVDISFSRVFLFSWWSAVPALALCTKDNTAGAESRDVLTWWCLCFFAYSHKDLSVKYREREREKARKKERERKTRWYELCWGNQQVFWPPSRRRRGGKSEVVSLAEPRWVKYARTSFYSGVCAGGSHMCECVTFHFWWEIMRRTL